jgi:hypothetical protein
MAPTCSLDKKERYGRMLIGSGFVVGGFFLRSDPFVAVTMVTVGSAMTAAAALGH